MWASEQRRPVIVHSCNPVRPMSTNERTKVQARYSYRLGVSSVTTTAHEPEKSAGRQVLERSADPMRLLLILGAGSAALRCGGFRAAGPSPVRLRALLPPIPATSAARHASPIASDVQRGIGAGRELPSPSGLNTLTKPLQAGVVLGISVAIAALALAIAGPGFAAVRGSDLWNLSRPTWPALGLIYLAAGVAHFTEAEGFENITPPNGTWGLWWTPFSPRVNVYWTGVVEIFGGEGIAAHTCASLLGVLSSSSLRRRRVDAIRGDRAAARLCAPVVAWPGCLRRRAHTPPSHNPRHPGQPLRAHARRQLPARCAHFHALARRREPARAIRSRGGMID